MGGSVGLRCAQPNLRAQPMRSASIYGSQLHRAGCRVLSACGRRVFTSQPAVMRFIQSKLLPLSGFLCLLAVAACDRSQQDGPPVTSLAVAGACDILQGCEAGDAALSVHVQFAAPARALKPFPVSVRTAGRQPVETVMLTFFMQGMDMGLNRYRLLGDSADGWRADVTLPICVSRRSDWIAEFEFMSAGQRRRLRVPFVLEK